MQDFTSVSAEHNRDNREKQVKSAYVTTLLLGFKSVTDLRVVELGEEF